MAGRVRSLKHNAHSLRGVGAAASHGIIPVMTTLLSPPLTALPELDAALGAVGHAVLGPASLRALLPASAAELDALRPSWADLPPDGHLRDGGRYRRRRHSCFVADGATLTQVPHHAHWQPLEYNALHGGLERWFEPMQAAVVTQPVWARLLTSLSAHCTALKGPQPWFVEAHQFRIDTTDGIGRPTPEGAHRDGVDFVAVLLIDRHGIKGGETRVFEADGPAGLRFTMTEPWTTVLLDDARVVHETTPIQPLAAGGHRDTLVLTFRRGGFQGPAWPERGPVAAGAPPRAPALQATARCGRCARNAMIAGSRASVARRPASTR